MRTRLFLSVVLMLLAIFSLASPPSASAQSNPRYINLGSGAVGALYTPNSGNYSHIGIVVGHPTLQLAGMRYGMGQSRIFGPLF
jgi:hypothetical protein